MPIEPANPRTQRGVALWAVVPLLAVISLLMWKVLELTPYEPTDAESLGAAFKEAFPKRASSTVSGVRVKRVANEKGELDEWIRFDCDLSTFEELGKQNFDKTGPGTDNRAWHLVTNAGLGSPDWWVVPSPTPERIYVSEGKGSVPILRCLWYDAKAGVAWFRRWEGD